MRVGIETNTATAIAIGEAAAGGSQFGADLHDGFEWVLQESPGSTVNVTNESQLLAALSNSGAKIDLGGNTISLSGQVLLPANADLTTIQNGSLTGGRIYKDNTAKWRLRNLNISSGSPEDNVKGEGGGFYDIDSCNIHNAPKQGILLYPHDDVCVRNCLVHDNGTIANGNQDHGIYTGEGSRMLLYNNVFYKNVAYQGQFYPHYHGGLIVCCTFYDGINRGGAVIGSENVDIVSDLRFIGCISTDSQLWGYEQFQSISNITFEDCLGWNNTNGDFDSGSFVVTRPVHGNPNFVNASSGNFRLGSGSAAVDVIDPSLYSLVPATDIDGTPRVTADAGAYAN